MAQAFHPNITARGLAAQLLATTSSLEEARRELDLCLGIPPSAAGRGPRLVGPARHLGLLTAAAHADPAVAVMAPRIPNLVRREGEYWTIAYEGTLLRLRDGKGLDYLGCLLRHPRREFHVADLVQMGRRDYEGDPPEVVPNPQRKHPGAVTPDAHAGDVLDARARAEYKERVTDLLAELEEATASGDLGRASRARQEIELISEQLAAAYGLHGRPRRAADPIERLRKAVGNRIKATLAKIREQHASLALHLANTIRTGVFCSYTPDRPILWEF